MCGGNYIMQDEELTFEDGILFCKHIFQCAIHKTLNNVPEQWAIFFKTHEALEKFEGELSNERLYELLFRLNMDDVYIKI